MNNRKKMLALAMFFLLATGCGVCHKNVVKNIANNHLLLEDAETRQERVVELTYRRVNRSFMDYVRPGDTILVRAPYYEENFILRTDVSTVLYFNFDTIIDRQRKAEFEAKKQEIFKGQTR